MAGGPLALARFHKKSPGAARFEASTTAASTCAGAELGRGWHRAAGPLAPGPDHAPVWPVETSTARMPWSLRACTQQRGGGAL